MQWEEVKIILNSINLNKLLTLSNFDSNKQIIMLLPLLTVQPGLCKTDKINCLKTFTVII